MTSGISPQRAAEAAKKIIGYYPEIPASDPKGFTMGLVQTLLIFPPAVIDRAVDPVQGIPAKVQYLNLAKIRKYLDEWVDEYSDTQRRREIAERRRLPEPPRNPDTEKRISDGFVQLVDQLKRGIGPSTV